MKRTKPLRRSSKTLKRTALTQTTPLNSYVRLTSRTPIRKVSRKHQKALSGKTGYTQFSKSMRLAFPQCEIAWEGWCTGETQGVHHVIKRSAGGALKPSALADAQGQVFMAACNSCNQTVENFPIEARLRNLVKDNPIQPGTVESKALRQQVD